MAQNTQKKGNITKSIKWIIIARKIYKKLNLHYKQSFEIIEQMPKMFLEFYTLNMCWAPINFTPNRPIL